MRRARALAIACAGGLIVLGVLLATVPGIRSYDADLLRRFSGPGPAMRGAYVLHVDRYINLRSYGVLCSLVALGELVRRRWRGALMLSVAIVAAPVLSELLKAILSLHGSVAVVSAGHLQVLSSSWPSGHTAAVVSLSLCATLSTPARWRALTGALGLGLTVAVTCDLALLGAHYPSHILAGYLVGGLCVALAVAGSDRPRLASSRVAVSGGEPPAPPSASTPPAESGDAHLRGQQ